MADSMFLQHFQIPDGSSRKTICWHLTKYIALPAEFCSQKSEILQSKFHISAPKYPNSAPKNGNSAIDI